ncbi:Protein RETARDED ROOT GROWTH mitochondrial [Euphorbia peplus]|nr:Protein RETARDED ROOT GROWTH mitochondrial [Euphorbia peplus]
MGKWRASLSLLLNHIPRRQTPNAPFHRIIRPLNPGLPTFNFRSFSAIPSRISVYSHDIEYESLDFTPDYTLGRREDEEIRKIPVKAYFLSTSIDLKRIQAENFHNVIPPNSRSTNYIVLRYCDFSSQISALGVQDFISCQYMVVFQYGSAVLFNIEEAEVESYLQIIRKYASGLLPEMRKDDYAIKEKPLLVEDMQGGPDYIVLKALDTDTIRIMGSVLGQSIALDYFVSQVDGMVEEFAGINRGMEKTGTFTMDRKKLLQLVGKANSNLADVILKVGLFERSEIAWRDAKYAQIYEYLREEYEVNQRFGNLDFKLKFVEHNIHFLQEVIQNRRSDLLEWLIIFLLSVENIISVYEIVHG